jgi:release factor glutamine methyltransferase
VLLGFVLQRDREYLFTHPEHEITSRELRRYRRVESRRLKGMPTAYITGVKEFYALPFRVNRHTLIPRPETEILVDEVIRRGPQSVLDMGTGCGCIGVAVSHHLPHCAVTALDISGRALRIARINARNLARTAEMAFLRSDFFSRLRGQRFDILVSNPPYVVEDDCSLLDSQVAAYEPAKALYGGRDGLDAYRAILGEGRDYLNNRGVLVLEISPQNSVQVQELAASGGYRVEKLSPDLSGNDRMLVLS